jgi:hypothetical protein
LVAACALAGAGSAEAACTAPSTGYAGSITSTAGLVGYWRLGETGSGTACDTAGTSNGTYQGGYTLGQPGATGDGNTAVKLDGDTGYVSVPDVSALDVGDNFTVEAWVKRNAISVNYWQTVVSKQSGAWLLMFDEGDHLVLRRSTVGNVATSTASVGDSNWHQIAATKNGSSVHLYIDGQDVTGSVSNATMANNTQPLVFGESSTTSFYDGSVDDVSVYNRVLSASQVKAHYDAAGTSSQPPPPPQPPPPSNGDPVIAAAGDIACDPGDPDFNNGLGTKSYCHQKATADLVVNTGLTGVLTLGDEQYDDGTLSKFQAVYDGTWGRANQLGHQGVGNHEYLTSGAKGYFDYFNGVGVNNGPAGPRGKGYYSFDIGTWHVIALNSNCSQVGGCNSGSAQEKWLRADLAAHPNQCTLAYWHHPRFSSGIVGDDSTFSTFWNDLYNANADLVLDGHDHDYERFAPQTPSRSLSSKGIREFVVGTGGKSTKPFDVTASNSQVRKTGVFGVLRLTLHPSSYDWQFVPEAGQTFTDSGTTACH